MFAWACRPVWVLECCRCRSDHHLCILFAAHSPLPGAAVVRCPFEPIHCILCAGAGKCVQGRGFVLKKLQTPDHRVCWSAPLFFQVPRLPLHHIRRTASCSALHSMLAACMRLAYLAAKCQVRSWAWMVTCTTGHWRLPGRNCGLVRMYPSCVVTLCKSA